LSIDSIHRVLPIAMRVSHLTEWVLTHGPCVLCLQAAVKYQHPGHAQRQHRTAHPARVPVSHLSPLPNHTSCKARFFFIGQRVCVWSPPPDFIDHGRTVRIHVF
jgi:hypothetical protein